MTPVSVFLFLDVQELIIKSKSMSLRISNVLVAKTNQILGITACLNQF